MTESENIKAQATLLLRQRGGRTTPLRVEVLTALMVAAEPLSHHDLLALLSNRKKVDRVSLYRALEWLVGKGVIHKITSEDRIWRFAYRHSHAHPHFHCRQCGKTLCMERMELPQLQLPEGMKLEKVELTIEGLCQKCGA